jgi:hypothetical protein
MNDACSPAIAVSKLAPVDHELRDEEVSHLGVTVRLHYHLARWHDGSTHLWASFERGYGTGEVRSGIVFDATTLTLPGTAVD